MTMPADFAGEIRHLIKGEITTDPLRMGVYATDASIYQIQPVAVVYPKDTEDILHVVSVASRHQIPLLPRGGATSLAGQTVGKAIVLDFTKYLHQVLEFNPEEHWIRVQPGITRDEVNAIVAGAGLEFAPDPATSSRATVGGMIANNSSGTKSILYGKTIDHVLDLTVLLADGTIIELAAMSRQDLATSDARLQGLHQLVQDHQDEIAARFPKTMRRVSGYPLDELVADDPWHPHKLFIGSEGTLGIILEARLHLVPLPKCKGVAVVQFGDRMDAVRAVQPMLEARPAAVEILSDTVLEYSRKNLETRAMCDFLRGSPAAIQIVEFYGDEASEVRQRAEDMFVSLRSAGLGDAFDFYPEGETYHNVWSIRKKGLGLLLGEPNDKRGIAFIEDAAIPVEVLPEYIERVLAICKKHGAEVTYYAHASVGVIHVRPILDLRQQGDIDRMKAIADEVFALVVHYGGAWSGEHGDGLVRSPFLRRYFGDTLYEAFTTVKELFDPHHLMNPGKIIDAPPMDANLRYGSAYRDQPQQTLYHYRDQKNFHTAVHQCTGIGACRKMTGGTMCPSYMVTRDELHSTRGR
ncbi:MAG: FAD-binding oxidoreductase, partial [Saprospiraceae bacterium]|nr:FAD-binding oxidoreductase [Saprospiraceae bacterium]